MKKLLLSGMALTLTLATFAQQSAQQLQGRLNPAVSGKVAKVTRPEDVMIPLRNVPTTTIATRSSMSETVIGSTFYDLQSNYGTVGNRVKLWDDNSISAIWTMSFAGAAGFPDRGTGYNYNDGVTGFGTLPNARIESFRTGFPNVSGTATMGEYVVNHGTNPTNIINRPTKGTGTWTESALGNTNVTWPRTVAGGNNGMTIHVIGNSNAAANGQSSEFRYSRSQDGGVTWDQENVVLPGADSASFYDPSVDGYDLDAKGDIVAIVMGGFSSDLALWKSMDNGTTWTKTVVNAFPLPAYNGTGNITDVDGDGVADTVLTTDSGPSLIIDNNGMVHIAVGLTRVLDDNPDPANSDINYFPGTDGLVYWNESLPAGNITNNVIAQADDIDGSGQIEIVGPATYQCSLTGMPTLGVDGVNHLHLVYSSVIENTTNGNPDPAKEESFRNVYYMYSVDNGATWSAPNRIEPSDFDEQAWPNMAKRVNNFVHLTYHKDGEPGNSFQPPNNDATLADAVANYDVIYNPIVNPVGIAEHNAAGLSTVIYPNPVHNVMNVDVTMANSSDMTVEIIDVLGQTVYNKTSKGVPGVNNLQINVKNLASGVYSLRTTVGNSRVSQPVVIQ